MKKYLIPFIFFPLISCNSTQERKTVDSEPPLVPDTTYVSDDIRLEIYQYDQLAPIFDRKDEKVHIINFWATWCVPCVQELPAFYELHDTYKQTVDITLVSLDFKSKIESDVIPFIRKNKIQPKVVLLNDPDGNTWIPKIDPDWSGAIPATLIYNSEKRVFYERSFNFEELEAETKQFLKK